MPKYSKKYRLKVKKMNKDEMEYQKWVYCPVCGNKIVENAKGFGCVNYRNGCKFALWKEDRFLQGIGKTMNKAMAEKLLKDKYCLVKVMQEETESIKILQLGIRNGRAVYRLLDYQKA